MGGSSSENASKSNISENAVLVSKNELLCFSPILVGVLMHKVFSRAFSICIEILLVKQFKTRT